MAPNFIECLTASA